MALKTFKLTLTGDLELNKLGQPTVLLGRAAIEQIILGVLSLWKGNLFSDLNRGVDWLGILKKNFTRRTIIQIVSSALIKVNAISEVLDVYINLPVIDDDPDKRRVAEITYLVVADGEKVKGTIPL